jgi:hypothetical protein
MAAQHMDNVTARLSPGHSATPIRSRWPGCPIGCHALAQRLPKASRAPEWQSQQGFANPAQSGTSAATCISYGVTVTYNKLQNPGTAGPRDGAIS